MGGLEKLGTPLASHRKVKGVFIAEDDSFQGEAFSQGSARIKLIMESSKPRQRRTLVMDGDKGWMGMDNGVFNLDDEFLTRLKRARHADRVAGLVTLLRDKGFALSLLGETKVKEKTTQGVKVELAGQPEMHLFFDKSTGLLVKSWQKFNEPGETRDVVHEMYYLDYQKIDPAAADEALLKSAGRPVDGPGLVRWLKGRVPAANVKERIAKVIAQLADNSFRVRARAAAELKRFGVEAAPLLRQTVKGADEEAARRAEEALAEIEQDAAVQQIPAVVRVLAWRRPAGVVGVLLDYLPWAPTDSIRGEIQAALYQLAQQPGPPDAVLVQALSHKDEVIRSAARAALGRDGGAYARAPGRRVPVAGVLLPLRSEMYRNGQRHMEMQTTLVEFFNAWPDRTFARPEPQN
jgi:hypothetical protein